MASVPRMQQAWVNKVSPDSYSNGYPQPDKGKNWLKPVPKPGESIDVWVFDEAIPFVCPVSATNGPVAELTIITAIPPDYKWTGGVIRPTEGYAPAGVTFNCTGQSTQVYSNDIQVYFTVTIQRTQPDVQTPWSINQNICWTIYPDGGAPIPLPQPGPLELYAIYGPQAPFIQKDGIPVELLRLFIPPVITTSITNEKDWIRWVATVSHGVQDPTQPFGTLRNDSSQHWLRYQVWTGAPSFIGIHGQGFNLHAWIESTKDHIPGSTAVNCFDQAGLVEIALGLGISNHRLNWEVKTPYGFIDADLVGWGRTNNAFFEGDKEIQNVMPANDPKRTPFRTHVFITVSPTGTYDRRNAFVVDACAGPVCGDLLYADYLEKCALQDGNPLLLQGKSPEDSTLAGVNGSNGTLTGHTLEWWLEDQYAGLAKPITNAIQEINTAFASETTVASDFSAKAVIDSVLNPILANKDEKVNAVLTSQIEKNIPPVTDAEKGSVTTERKLVALADPEYPTFVSFKFTVFSGGVQSATKALQSHLGLFSQPATFAQENEINVKGAPARDVDVIDDPRIQVFGNVHLSLFVYKNVLVSIGGNAVKLYIPQWTKAIFKELKKY